jgi:hypothetical protein
VRRDLFAQALKVGRAVRLDLRGRQQGPLVNDGDGPMLHVGLGQLRLGGVFRLTHDWLPHCLLQNSDQEGLQAERRP